MCAEIVSAEPVAIQFWEAPVPILSAIGTVTVASLMPILRDAPTQGYGPLTPYVELVNARSAMYAKRGLGEGGVYVGCVCCVVCLS